jgi:hypothetical protein
LRRFLAAGRVMLETAEKEYGIPMAAEKDYDYRVGRLRHAILDNVAERLGLTSYDKKSDAIVKLRHLLAVLEMISVKFPDPRLPSPSDQDLAWANRECQKAYDFIVIKPEYLLSRPTAERFYEWLARFETYCLARQIRARAARMCSLQNRSAFPSTTRTIRKKRKQP